VTRGWRLMLPRLAFASQPVPTPWPAKADRSRPPTITRGSDGRSSRVMLKGRLRRNAIALAFAISTLTTMAARADDPGSSAATQVVGLFVQSCVRFVGNAADLRQWAHQTGLPLLPKEAQQSFLYGLPGEVYDASTPDDKLVLISEDGGSCSALAESANGEAVAATLERVMRAAHIAFMLTHEDDDTEEKALHHRSYAVSRGGRQWQMLVSTVKDTASGEVMLTANP
jgi:hypothetical protein